jgi:cellulose synthase/poly-beta-1,6-N-acetylglucosamine synthase-like glycosyltransferase
MILLELFLICLALLLASTTALLLAECLAGCIHSSVFESRKDSGNGNVLNTPAKRPSVDVLIPAHNEQALIRRTIECIQSSLHSRDRVCVVADNCTDSTAEISRELGAVVVERFHETQRGKGFAVAAGLDFLANQPRDVVVIVDADCVVNADAIEHLAKDAVYFNRPVQARYQMACDSSGNGWGAVSTFAITVKNFVRPLGLHRLGFGCVLTGSGIALPASLANASHWKNGNIVEDMKISYDMMIDNNAPKFCERAIVLASLPESRSEGLDQRRRWEHGHLQTMAAEVPRLLVSAVRTRRLSLLIAAMDLLIPPLALFVQLWVLSLVVIALTTWIFGLSGLPFWLTVLAGLNLFVAVGTAWFVHGRSQIPLSRLCMIPLYVCSKLPLYLTAIFAPQLTWNRTRRTGEQAVCT